MASLEFPGGIAYDHEALPKIVAVHTLIGVNPDQINAQDVSVNDSVVKKPVYGEVPLIADKTASRHRNRKWIIHSKPELPFSQITTAPKTPEEMFKPLSSSSSHDAFSTKKLFNLCDINHGYSYVDIYENKTPVPPSQAELPTSTASKDTSWSLMLSEHLNESKKQKETQAEIVLEQSNETEKEKPTKKINEIVGNEKETLKALKWDHSNHLVDSAIRLGRSLNFKQEDSPAKILATSLDVKDFPSVKFSGPSVKTERVEENKKEKIKASHTTSILLSDADSITPCADIKEHFYQTSKTAKPNCSGTKLTSKEPKKTLGKMNNDTPIVGKGSQKQRAAASKKNLVLPILNSEQETCNKKTTTVPKNTAKLEKTSLPTETTRSLKRPANCSSTKPIAAEKSSAPKNIKNVKLTLRDRVMHRIKRLKDNTKSYKETQEAKNLYVKLAKYRKLGFGVASSLNELSKSGEINTNLEVAKNGQVKKMALSEELLEEVVLMEELRKEDRKTLKSEFTTEQKNLDLELNESTSKNGMKESEETQNEGSGTEVSAVMECSLTVSELGFVNAGEVDSNVIHSIGSEPIQELQNILEKVNGSDVLNGEKTLNGKQGVNWNERVDDVLQTSTPEKGKSLNKCLDKLKSITSSVKRTLDSDKENALHAYNPDSGSISKRPRKAIPRRLAKGRWSSFSDDDSISPDTSWTDHPPFNLTSSDLDDQSSNSSFSTCDAKGQEREVTDELLCDGRTLSEKSDLSPNEENLKIENMSYDDSIIISAQCLTEKLETSPSIALPEGVTTTFDNGLIKNLPPTRLFTKDTQKEQMEEAAWEPYWFSGKYKTAVSHQSWVDAPCTTIPQENYTIKTSLDREERIKALLAKQNQLLSKINSNISGNSLS